MVAQTYMRPSSYAAAIPEGNFKPPTTADILRNAQTMGGMVQDYQTRKQKEELGEAMAGIPDAEKAERVVGDTEQSAMLAEQTADFADTPGGIPATEAEALQAAGQKRMTTTTKDWKSWEDNIMEKAGKMGPEAVAAAQAHIAQTQHSAFEKDAKEAMQLLKVNPQAAARALERAYSNMPDGNTADITVGPNGTLMVQVIDEETGQPEGEPAEVGAQDIAEFVEMTRDPVAWSTAINENRAAAEESAEKTRQFDEEQAVREAAEARLSEGTAEDKAQNKVNNELNKKKQELEERKADLEGRKNLQGGMKRAAEVRKLEAEVKLAEAKAKYYAAGGSQKNEATFFKKRNEILQRLNTASSAFADADEQMARHQRYKEAKPDYVIPPAAQDAYDRELAKYKMIMDMWDDLDREELAKSGAPPAAAAEQQAAIPAEGTAPAAAPAAAIELLRSNPSDEMKEYFRQQFGYLPDTI